MEDLLFSIVSFLGLVLYCIRVTIPITDIYEIYRTKEVSKYPYLVLISFSFSAYFWTFYGIKQESKALFYSSFYGFLLNMIYLIVFIISTSYTYEIKNIMIAAYLFIFATLLVVEYLFNLPNNFYGFIGNIFSILSVIATLHKIKEILQYRDISYIPIKLMITYFLNSCLWEMYGILSNFDLFLIVPNLLGIALNGFQVFIYYKFSSENQVNYAKFEEKVQLEEKEERFSMKRLRLLSTVSTEADFGSVKSK